MQSAEIGSTTHTFLQGLSMSLMGWLRRCGGKIRPAPRNAIGNAWPRTGARMTAALLLHLTANLKRNFEALAPLRGLTRAVSLDRREPPWWGVRNETRNRMLRMASRYEERERQMKLYDGGRAPNPRRTRIFLAEKGVTLSLEQVDLGALQQKSPDYTAINPLQRVPALVLDDGTVITESIAICRYFEALHPEPPLFGRSPLEIACIEMWNRRLELHFFMPVSHVFRNSHPAMKEMEVPQVPAWAEANKPRILDFIALLDAELKDRPFIAGDSFTVADITGLVAVDFMKPAKLSVPSELANLKRWHAAVSARPSASA
jgi:glutathione S-transferase